MTVYKGTCEKTIGLNDVNLYAEAIDNLRGNGSFSFGQKAMTIRVKEDGSFELYNEGFLRKVESPCVAEFIDEANKVLEPLIDKLSLGLSRELLEILTEQSDELKKEIEDGK